MSLLLGLDIFYISFEGLKHRKNRFNGMQWPPASRKILSGLAQMKKDHQHVLRASCCGTEEDLARSDIHFLPSSNLNTHLLHAK